MCTMLISTSRSNDLARLRVIAAAEALIRELENRGEQMARIGWGEPSRTAALRTAFEPGFLKKLGEKPMGSVELTRIMKHLAANGIVKESGKDAYVGTPFSTTTNDPTIEAGLTSSFEGMISAFMGLPNLQSNQRLGSAFNNFMEGDVLLVDVGGGFGHETSALHAAHPELPGKLIVQDLESVVSKDRASKTLPDIVALQTHDFFFPQPVVGAKVYFLRLILHDWADDKCGTIMKHLRKAMRKGYSRILINEAVLQDVGAPWQHTSLDLTMMAMLVNRERIESRWASLLSQVGLITGIWSKESESVIEAALADDET
ncbi:O-methyltransferase-domain-containing protein [Coniochaeta sp. 2T2.1]|nr:O-methyltransferase-domain-containing protein [Coniochaeta sp. 2T2.1]